MYTKEQVDEMLSEVENEINIAFETMNKNENTEEEVETVEVETSEESLDKSEEIETEETGEEEYETIDDLYASMEKNEMEAHYVAVKKALFGEETGEELEKSDDDDLSPHAKEQKAKKEQKIASMKADTSKGYDAAAHSDDEAKSNVKKSEEVNEVEMLKSENEELKKSYEELNALVEKLFNKDKEAPKGKALTGYDVINKSEETETEENKIESLSKSEVTKKLKSIDYSTLTKSDREAINEYCLENGSVEKIKHLIKE